MVHRPIFLGLSFGISPQEQTLNLSITINDGFFVLGTKNYAFPIISADETSPSTSPSTSPQISVDEEEPDNNEFEEIKGMFIDLKKKIVLTNYSTTDVRNNRMNKLINPHTYARLRCQTDKHGTEPCIIEEEVVSKVSPAIKKECARDAQCDGGANISFEYFAESTLDVISDVLIVILDKWIGEYSKGNAIKIVGAGVATQSLLILSFVDKLKTLLWRKYDILPCFFSGDDKPLDQQSESLARKCASMFGHENLPRLSIAQNNEVNVDGGNIWFCSLNDYKEYMGEVGTPFMDELMVMAKEMAQQRVLYFSSTPQGGGVSLMRHALMRFFRMIGMDASWFVCIPSPSVFCVTKKKVHNILQGVAPSETCLTDTDKNKIDKWLKTNYETNWKHVVAESNIIVLDDHQVARLVPLIRKDRPDVKIIYRSHIQIRGENLNNSEQLRNVWGYLWESLKEVDFFVSHPIPTAVPEDVPPAKIIYQPAGTDPIDGLNKELEGPIKTYYQNVFNRICIDHGEVPVDFSRPYIVQVARFDPSKGIPDLLEAYYKLYQQFSAEHPEEKFSIGLVLCGHGSVDDPEYTAIFRQISSIIEGEKYLPLKHLITKIQIPPSDQLLNIVLSCAKVCCQLSVCEGYEVKVTESLMKKVPAIVYNVGGLPLQIIDGVNGYIVEKHDTSTVARHLYQLIFDKQHYRRIQDGIAPRDFSYILTPFQAMFWLYLFKIALAAKVPEDPRIFYLLKQKYFPTTEASPVEEGLDKRTSIKTTPEISTDPEPGNF